MSAAPPIRQSPRPAARLASRPPRRCLSRRCSEYAGGRGLTTEGAFARSHLSYPAPAAETTPLLPLVICGPCYILTILSESRRRQSWAQARNSDSSRTPPFAARKKWRVAVIANIKDEGQPLPPGVPADAFADFDHIETIDEMRRAMETDGHKTTFLHADSTLPRELLRYKPDICFNMAEGLGGDAREAQVPALLEMLRIPYTASRVQTNAISLDKTLTKRIWRDRRLPVAPFQEFILGDESCARI